MKKRTWIDLQSKLKEVFKDDYSNFLFQRNEKDDYRNASKIEIQCIKHNFTKIQRISYLVNGSSGCRDCFKDKMSSVRAMSKEDFIDKAVAIHGSLYEYSDMPSYGHHDKITYTCTKHGGQYTTSQISNFLNGHISCPECIFEKKSAVRKLTQIEFIQRITSYYGDNYDLSEVVYNGNKESVKVVCNKHNITYYPTATALLNSSFSCDECFFEMHGYYTKMDKEKFLWKARLVWGDKYDYSDIEYKAPGRCIYFKCKETGEVFFQKPKEHIRGVVPVRENHRRLRLDQDAFTDRAYTVWGSKYDYSMSIYKGSQIKMDIRCKEHNKVFQQTPECHWYGFEGCSGCNTTGTSKGEIELGDYIESLGFKIIRNDRSILDKKEIDIIVENTNTCFEFNGTYYHSDAVSSNKYRDRDKMVEAQSKGLDLMVIWEYDWINPTKKEILKRMIRNKLGVNDDVKINARSCEIVKDYKTKEVKEFIDNHHIQGNPYGYSTSYGLFHKNELVAIMTFKKSGSEYILQRYCTSKNVRGGASKLFNAFMKDHPDVVRIISYSDIQTFSGGLYEVLGFKEGSYVQPSYSVWHTLTGIRHKSAWRRISIPKRLSEVGSNITFDPKSDKRTEWEIQDSVRALRVWDCGKIKWIYSR